MDAYVSQVLSALGKSIDADKLRAAMPQPATESVAPQNEVLGKLVLSDILDPTILGARPGEKSFPLRILLSKVSESLASEGAFSFACGLGFYFRASMDEESRMRLGIEVSRAFYRFAEEADIERAELAKAAPLLATIMNGELERVKLESVDHLAVFDSQVHERDPGGDATSSDVVAVKSFLCRVGKTNVVRSKAMVRT